ncbi:uncharacterized protein LAESUDRAFT_725815 [Laetiporus sulphureus 93-53]|uniref:Uncharacterized protein n=1 Tax=Laetiporus sulphureus 93-53 TaxID=1314785 RepID=A0A165ECC8_9APHY|nr:uncharacterized protein LAESUDRAFT_725815 [Laetiporus sulphureus 93-53]KZT06719.1 hypothetical protein LAESUDRAFT_725815 [Laetiporus sulphureus 93-53]
MLPTSYSTQHALYGTSQSYPSLNFGDISGGLFGSQPFSSQSSLQSYQTGISGHDSSSPEVFKQSIQPVLGELARVQNLARSALAGIEHAYHPGTNPMQTASDMTALYQALQGLSEILRQSGVGALPVQPPDLSNPPKEQQLMVDTTKAIEALFQRQKRLQDSAAVVVSLLGTDHAARRAVRE